MCCDRRLRSKRRGGVINRSVIFALALGVLAGCRSPDPFRGRDHLNCQSVAELESLPTLRATVEKIQPCGVILRTEDGKSLSLAGPLGGEPAVERFMRTLEDGKTYTFPNAFLEFRKHENAPNKELKATEKSAP